MDKVDDTMRLLSASTHTYIIKTIIIYPQSALSGLRIFVLYGLKSTQVHHLNYFKEYYKLTRNLNLKI